jgi:nicotinamide-nucleotide amidase
MPTAEILTIGTEILLGEIQDTNTAYLARSLKDLGVDLYRTQTVGDNAGRIAAIIRDILSRADILITTGGLGPTVDDPTRQAVADALGVPLEFHPECWEQIQTYFTQLNRPMPENNRRQAYLPAGAIPVLNPVGTAPGFIVDTGKNTIASVPGVPKEMEHLVIHSILPYLKTRWQISTVIRTRVIHTSGLGEAVLDDLVGEYEQWKNPTVGLLAKAGIVDIRVGAKADSEAEADRMIDDLIAKIVPTLGEHDFGYDLTTLPDAVVTLVKRVGIPVSIRANGMDGALQTSLQRPPSLLTVMDSLPELQRTTRVLVDTTGAGFTLTVEFNNAVHPAELTIQIKHPDESTVTLERKFGGPSPMAPQWAVNTILDTLRRLLLDHLKKG